MSAAEAFTALAGNEMAAPKASQHVRATLCRPTKPPQHLHGKKKYRIFGTNKLNLHGYETN
ncbi:hypothetical protein B5F91_10225 [Bacteroides sp. An322]|nr:hypothetical protein B5F91_10225 [Bacteroides sp. An322]